MSEPGQNVISLRRLILASVAGCDQVAPCTHCRRLGRLLSEHDAEHGGGGAEVDRAWWGLVGRIQRLAGALPDPAKLAALADWLDQKFPEEDSLGEVQFDLRKWARLGIEAVLLGDNIPEPTGQPSAPADRLANRVVTVDDGPSPHTCPACQARGEHFHTLLREVAQAVVLLVAQKPDCCPDGQFDPFCPRHVLERALLPFGGSDEPLE